mmetsp:Transcript_21753/g.60465  ORF Transcript_21753/g.60465 Transcript_21753/m.60465 type:complete len:93 (+) Transcript_21753:144-422(+)
MLPMPAKCRGAVRSGVAASRPAETGAKDLHPLTCVRVLASIMVIMHHATLLLLIPGPDIDTEDKVRAIYDAYSSSTVIRALVCCYAGDQLDG